ncbi:MAG: hypothetical protein OEW43_04385 [Elusimicrobiota bacterium]|nr:hypothetical protein [Elusimicrobiota bacterium]
MKSTFIEGKWIFPLIFALAFFLAVPLARAEKGEKEITELLKLLELGAPISYRNLTIVPIHSRTVKGLTDYVTLDEAVRKGYITITEVEGGRVPQAKVVNKSRHHIFMMAGEMLTGCKQDRLVGKDILLGPKSEVILPVYCSERGRWTSVGKQFKALDTAAIPELRRMIQEEASQGEIWSNIGKQHAKLGVKANTDALREVYEHEETKKEMDSYVARLERIPQLTEDTVGVVVGIGEEVVSIDIFLNHHLFAELWPKLLRSYAMGAIQAKDETPEVTREKAKELLNKIYKASYARRQGLDLGEEITMSSPEITSFALVYRSSVVHLSLFPTEGVKGSALPRIPVIE